MGTSEHPVQVAVPRPDDVSYLDERRRAGRLRRQERAMGLRQELERRAQVGDTRRLADGHLGSPLPEQVRRHHEELQRRIHAEIRDGATVHGRVPFAVRQIPWAVALLDGLVLFTFCAAIFNVDLTAPFTLEGAFAAMLALLGTGIAYAWLALTGARLRCYRTELGEISWRIVGRLTQLMLAMTGVVVLCLAVLMYVRVVGDATAAAEARYLAPSAVTVLGVVFAIVSVAANLAVVAVHALDGSEPARELRHSGHLLKCWERDRERVRRRNWRRCSRAERTNR